jgi:hypothetical protein
MAKRNIVTANVKGFGAPVLAAVRFVPAASQGAVVIEEQWGVSSVTRDNTGVYTISLVGKPRGFVALPTFTENDTTTFHFVRVESQSDSAGTVTISHKSVAFASVASGPSASDTVDAITVVFYARGE